MKYLNKNDRLWSTFESIALDEGLSLYDLEHITPRSFRVYIARKDAKESVSSGDCSRLCRRLMVYFQAEGDSLGVGSEPEIEVSSPGINRHLRLSEHFELAIGERVKFYPTAAPVDSASATSEKERQEAEVKTISYDGSKPVVGIVEKCEGGALTVADELSHQIVTFKLHDVRKASVEFKFS